MWCTFCFQMFSPQAKKGLEFGGMMSPGFKLMPDFDAVSDCGSVVSSSSHPNKPESKKHPSLPKEVSTVEYLFWLAFFLTQDNYTNIYYFFCINKLEKIVVN